MGDQSFTVACLGASAGGLDAYRQIIRGIPADADLAVVVINHMRSQSQILLLEILARETSMPVHLIAEGMRLEQGHVYVIPPNCDLRLRDGAFRLDALSKSHGWPNVVTVFLESLAATWKGQRAAVILSGLDSDGAEALRSIKAAGGITFAQRPETAAFPSMPQSAIDTGYVDFTLSPEEIAGELVRIPSKHLHTKELPKTSISQVADEVLDLCSLCCLAGCATRPLLGGAPT